MKFSLALKKTLLSFFTAVVLALSITSFTTGTVYADGLVGRQESPTQVDSDTPPSSSDPWNFDAALQHVKDKVDSDTPPSSSNPVPDHLAQLESGDFSNKPASGPDEVRKEQAEFEQQVVKEDASEETVIELTNATDGSGSNKGSDPTTYLPINRWGGSQPVAGCALGGIVGTLKSIPCTAKQTLAGLLYTATSFIWNISYTAVNLSSQLSFSDGGPASAILGSLANEAFNALQGSLFATGIVAMVSLALFIQIMRRALSGKTQGIFRIALVAIIPLVLLTTMATAVSKEAGTNGGGGNPGSVVGSPVWIASGGLGQISGITTAFTTTLNKLGDTVGGSGSGSSATATSCQAYVNALDDMRKQLSTIEDDKVDSELMLSEFWMASYMQPLIESQFGSSDLESNRVWCHLYESENNVPRSIQVELGLLAGYPDHRVSEEKQEEYFNAYLGKTPREFTSLNEYLKAVGQQTDPYGIRQYGSQHSKLVAANFWQACIWNGNEWEVQPAWRDVSAQAIDDFDEKGSAYSDEACASWWYLGDGTGHLRGGGVHDIWPAASPAPETVADYTDSQSKIGGFVPEQPSDVYRHTAAGYNTGFWPGAVALLTALILLAPVISLAFGSAIATIAFALLLAALPITLLLLAIGRKEQGSSAGKKLFRATLSFGALSLSFQLGMAALLFTTKFVQTALTSLTGDGFVGYLASMLSPIVAIVLVRSIYKRIGFGSLTNPAGAAAAVMAAGNLAAEGSMFGKGVSSGERMDSLRRSASEGMKPLGFGNKKHLAKTNRFASSGALNLDRKKALAAVANRGAVLNRFGIGDKLHSQAQRTAAKSVVGAKGSGADGENVSVKRLTRARAGLLVAAGTALGAKSAAKQEGIEASKMKQQFNQAKTFLTARTDSDREAHALQKQNMRAVDATAAEILDESKREGRFLTKADARAEARRRIADGAINSVASVTDPLTGEPLMSDGAEVKAIYRIDEATGLKVRVNPEEAGALMVNGELQLNDGFYASTALSSDTRWSDAATKEIAAAYAESLGIAQSSVVVDPVSGQSFPAPPKVKKDANGQVVGLEYPKDMSEAAQEEYAKLGINTWEPSTIQKYERLESDRERAAFMMDYLASNGQISAAGEIIPAFTLHGKSKNQVMEVMALAADGDSTAAMQLVVTPRRGAAAAAEAAALKVRHEEVVWNKRAQLGERVEVTIASYMKDLPQARADYDAAVEVLSTAYAAHDEVHAECTAKRKAVEADVTLSVEAKQLEIANIVALERESAARKDAAEAVWSEKAAVVRELGASGSALRKLGDANAANEDLETVAAMMSDLADAATGKSADQLQNEMLEELRGAWRKGKAEDSSSSPVDLPLVRDIGSQADTFADAEKQRAKRNAKLKKDDKPSRAFGKNTKPFPN